MGTRAIKRNFAKKFKSEERDKHPGLKKASVGKIMKTVDTSGIEESLPLEEICIFTVMVKTLQYSIGVLEKFNKFKSITEVLENKDNDDIFNSINLFILYINLCTLPYNLFLTSYLSPMTFKLKFFSPFKTL